MTYSLPSVATGSALLLVAALFSACAAPPRSAAQSEPKRTHASQWTEVGESRGGRPIRRFESGTGDRKIAIIAGIHGSEPEGRRHVEELVDVIARHPERARTLVIEDVNPDGSAAGRRTTDAGVDPNRNWPSDNFVPHERHGEAPLSEPGVAATHAELVAFDPDLVIVLHSTARGPFVNFDGPAEADAELFAGAAGWRVVPSMGYPTPGSLGSYMGVDRGVPILTIEFERDSDPMESGPALVRGIEAVLSRESSADPVAGAATSFRVR